MTSRFRKVLFSVRYAVKPKKKKYFCYWDKLCFFVSGPGSSVGIVTELRAGRSGDRIPVGARFSAPVQTGPGAHPASCSMGTGSFPGIKSDWGVTLTPHPLLVPWSWKSRAIHLPPPPIGRTACTEPQCLYKGDLYLYLYFTFYVLCKVIDEAEERAVHRTWSIVRFQVSAFEIYRL
jgi:hypothetical protein